MQLLPIFEAFLLGITEGVTEWLPVSSTGHLLLLERMLPLRDTLTREFYDFFLVAVQLGAVLAVALRFFGKINPFSLRKNKALQAPQILVPFLYSLES